MTCPGSSPTERSITMTRRGTAIWGAARPMPGAAYIVSIMSATSVRMSPSISPTGSEGRCSSSCPYLTMGLNAIWVVVDSRWLGRRTAGQELAPAAPGRVEVAQELVHGVSSELLHHGVRQDPRHHGLSHDARRGDDAGVAPLHGGGLRLLGLEVDGPQGDQQRGDGLDDR